MRHKLTLFYILILIFACLYDCAPACCENLITLSEALALAASNSALAAKSAEIEKRKAAACLAGERGPSTVSLEVENFSGDLSGFSNSESTLSVKRPFLDARRLKAEKALAAVVVNSAQNDFEIEKLRISNNVQSAFHKALNLMELEKTAETGVQLAERALTTARDRVDAGSAAAVEIVKAEVELERAEIERDRAAGRVLEARTELAKAIGVGNCELPLPVGSMSSEIKLPNREVLLENTFKHHPDIIAFDSAENELRAAAKTAALAGRPVWSAGVGLRRFQEDDSHAFVVQFEAELPNKRAVLKERRNISGDVSVISAARKARLQELEKELDAQITRFNANRAALARLKQNVLPNTASLVEKALEGYRLGKTDQLAVLEAQKAFLESRREYIEALGELYEAMDAIESLCGICLVGESH